MNISTSQCSSGCESGWTLYLDQSSGSGNECPKDERGGDEGCGRKNAEVGRQQDEEEDLSMVSDASSGPPHFHVDADCFAENGCFCSSSLAPNRSQKKKKIKVPCTKQQHSSLDDTASSPVLTSSKKTFSPPGEKASMEHGLDFSQGFSATHFKGKPAFQRHINFFKSPFADKKSTEQPGGCEEREWE